MNFDIWLYKEALSLLKQGYLNHKKLLNWQSKYQEIYSIAKDWKTLSVYKKFNKKGEYTQEIDILWEFIEYIENWEEITKQYNKNFVASQKDEYKTFFDKEIEEYPLNEQQREAILHDEDYNLIVAGAGTGKTTTIVGKTLHLVNNEWVDPNKILLISFTNKAVDEMKERLNEKWVWLENIKTFHWLWYDVLGNVEGKKTALDADTDEKEIILQWIFDSLLTDEIHSQTLYEYFSYYLEHYKSSDEFKSEDEYYDFFKKQGTKFRALDWTIVKSPDEVNIANFLYIHNISYEYERDYEHNTMTNKNRQYKPDFYLSDYWIYLEHFALYEDGISSSFWQEYVEWVKWKRELHQKHKTKLIETHSWEFKKKHIPQLLKEKLEVLWVTTKPKDVNQIIEELQKHDDYSKFTWFVKLLGTCISLLKSNQYSIEEINNRAKDIRDIKFLEILDIAYKKYTNKLNEIDKIDFDDMISQATKYMKENSVRHNYDYILVDEFQDISAGRYKLLKSFLDQKDDCKLFCVWDDWQSIYRFTGSDVHIFTEFENYFWYSKTSTIDKCYRFPQKLLDISSNFVMKNPSQMRKHLTTDNKNNPTIEIKFIDNDSLFKKVSVYSIRNEIETTADINKDKEIYVLCRYNLDIARLSRNFDIQNSKETLIKKVESMSVHNDEIKIIDDTKEVVTDDLGYQFPKNVEFLTAHKSKGKERDIIYILISTKWVYGFPSLIADDPVLDMFLAYKDEIDYAEERRLFYVAITRAKERICIITSKENMSPFVREMIENYWNNISISNLHTEFYAYFISKDNYNIVNTREECQKIVQWKSPQPQFQWFNSEKEAKEWLNILLEWGNPNSIKKDKEKWYAYYVNKNDNGIVHGIDGYNTIIKGRKGITWNLSFKTENEANACLERRKKQWYGDYKTVAINPWVYFDSGKKWLEDTRISVTNEQWDNFLHEVVSKELLDYEGKMVLPKKTNNYWELLALKYAIEIAMKLNIKEVYGDSKNAIDFRSKWQCSLNDTDTKKLSEETTKLREKFESQWWQIEWISWSSNPADLGDHK